MASAMASTASEISPRARWRSQVVSYRRPEPDLKAQEVEKGTSGSRSSGALSHFVRAGRD